MLPRMTVRTSHRISLLGIALILPATAQAGGACCVVQVNGSDQPRVGLAIVHAQSHEKVAGEERSFSQQGLVLRVSWPLPNDLSVSGSAGLPIRTDLQGVGAGFGGWMAGAGLAWTPRLWDPAWGMGISVSPSRSVARLGSSATWTLTELQGTAFLDRDVTWSSSLYAGVRGNLSRAELEWGDIRGKVPFELHPTGFAGWKKNWGPRIATVVEAGFGHGALASLGISTPLP